ncbi:CheR family methyltransferase [Caballeronia insecticola]|uniref:MCP methyltransferase CheR-type with Tpr repeats n=1 Tax=Caballeronia insecticola TaxID=758793 RepID=R4X2U4_9BURK|nr:CheR family methyltransferase [Caballeronia insecticola]BAN25812.1 MCP methyltransferase CheR-type with Tpr repeats [Caballeronia insecticola]
MSALPTPFTDGGHDASSGVGRFIDLLHRTIGLDAESIGANSVSRAVHERYHAWRSEQGDTLDDYYRAVMQDPARMQELIEAVVVPETWFFRDPEAFAALARLARVRLHERPAKPVRVLSAPCSTGEEAYSIAMALIEAGMPADRFTIDAIDVSERALAVARRAHYGRNAFRGRMLDFRERHFRAADGGWQLDAAVAQSVRFTQANLLQLDTHAFERFDFILCRNVLIYFDRDTQCAVLRVLDGLLADGGTLFVGPAETGLLMREGMSSANIPLAFAFNRPERASANVFSGAWPNVPVATSPKPPPKSAFVLPAWASAPLVQPAPQVRKPVAQQRVQPEPADSLAHAHTLADAGQLDAAAHAARAYVSAHPSNADAYYLLGIIADARGDRQESRGHYRRALYLDPAHREALTHLAALLTLDGDESGARLLIARAERVTGSTR